MKLIRWLLSNIILIALVLVLSYLYVYWDNLTGEDTPAGKTFAWLSDEFEAVEGLLGYLKVSGNPSDEASDSDADEQVAALTGEANVPADEPVAVQNTDTQPATTDRFVTPEIVESLSRVGGADTAPKVPMARQPYSRQGGVGEANAPSRPGGAGPVAIAPSRPGGAGPVAIAPSSQGGAGSVGDTSQEQSQSMRELWINARKSFHRRDFDASISSYEQLISRSEDNFDAYGELGNVYFNQGKMKEAASSYYEAAAIMVRLGQVERANSLMGMLGQLDPEKAKELQALILSTRS